MGTLGSSARAQSKFSRVGKEDILICSGRSNKFFANKSRTILNHWGMRAYTVSAAIRARRIGASLAFSMLFLAATDAFSLAFAMFTNVAKEEAIQAHFNWRKPR